MRLDYFPIDAALDFTDVPQALLVACFLERMVHKSWGLPVPPILDAWTFQRATYRKVYKKLRKLGLIECKRSIIKKKGRIFRYVGLAEVYNISYPEANEMQKIIYGLK